MRKVYIEAELEVPVMARVKVSLIVRADQGADVHKVVESWARGKRYGKADVERHESEIVAVDGIDHSDDYTTCEVWLSEAVETRLDGGGCKLLNSEVTDSK
jgi:hypothetical protein